MVFLPAQKNDFRPERAKNRQMQAASVEKNGKNEQKFDTA